MRTLLVFMLLCGVAAAGEIGVVKGDKTSADEYFEYVNDGVAETYDGVRINGRITNISQKSFDMVAVTLTIKDESGKFITRDHGPVSPMKINPGNTSFYELDIKMPKGAQIGIIEWSVSRAMEMP